MRNYENLVQLATKQGRTIPILQMVRVKNGKASTTDMDLQITVPAENGEDGLYHGYGFDEGIQVKSDAIGLVR